MDGTAAAQGRHPAAPPRVDVVGDGRGDEAEAHEVAARLALEGVGRVGAVLCRGDDARGLAVLLLEGDGDPA